MAAKNARQNKLDSFIDGQYQSLDNKVKIFVLLLAIAIPLAGMYYAVYEPNIEKPGSPGRGLGPPAEPGPVAERTR